MAIETNLCHSGRLRLLSSRTPLHKNNPCFPCRPSLPAPKGAHLLFQSFSVSPCPAEGDTLQNHPLSLSFMVEGVSAQQRESSGTQGMLRSAGFKVYATCKEHLASFQAQLPSAGKVRFLFLVLSVTHKLDTTSFLGDFLTNIFLWKVRTFVSCFFGARQEISRILQMIILPYSRL